MKAFLIALCISLSVLSAGLIHALLKQSPYARNVETEQNSDRLQTKKHDNGEGGQANQPIPALQSVGSEGGNGKCCSKTENSEDEGTEFWPPFSGYRLKITDTLVAGFTALLFFATRALWLATRKLVTGAEITAERQLRAYVFVREAFIRNLDGPDIPIIHIYVKNYGQTPAYNYTNAGGLKYTKFPCFDFERNPNGDQRVAVTTLPPSGDSAIVVNLPFVITPELKSELKEGRSAIYVFGRLEYKDVFKKTRIQNYRFLFGGDAGTRTYERDGVRLGAMAQTIDGNSPEGEC